MRYKNVLEEAFSSMYRWNLYVDSACCCKTQTDRLTVTCTHRVTVTRVDRHCSVGLYMLSVTMQWVTLDDLCQVVTGSTVQLPQ